MELKKIFKNTSYLASTQIVVFITGIVRSKLSALILGTYGVGVFSQLQNLISQVSNFTLLGTNEGAIKLIAQNKDLDDAKLLLASIIKTYSLIVSALMVVVCILGLVFASDLTRFYLGSTKLTRFFIIGFVAFPFVILNSIYYGILNGFKEIKYISRAMIAQNLIAFMTFIPLIFFFKLDGAIFYIPLGFVLTFLINYLVAQRRVLSRIGIRSLDILKAKMQKRFMGELFVFVGVGTLIVFSNVIVELFSRSVIANKLGVEKIGIYAPITAWAGLVFSFIAPSLNTYLFPRFSELKNDREIIAVLNDTLRLISFVMLPINVVAILSRYLIIPLFYSSAFIEAAEYLPYHFIGVLFLMWMYALTYVLAPTGRIKTQGVLTSLFGFTKLGLLYFFVNKIGMWAWVLQFSVAPFLFWWVYYFYLKIEIGLKIETANLFLMNYTVALSGISIVLPYKNPLTYLAFVVLLSLVWFMLRTNEKLFVRKIVKKLSWAF